MTKTWQAGSRIDMPRYASISDGTVAQCAALAADEPLESAIADYAASYDMRWDLSEDRSERIECEAVLVVAGQDAQWAEFTIGGTDGAMTYRLGVVVGDPA